ncbi:MAG: amidohydrolase family protein [Gemmatimonadota bacterium]
MEKVTRLALMIGLAALLSGASMAWVEAQSYDLLIRGGRVLDGTGNPAVVADVAIAGGRIVRIGKLGQARAKRIIDAAGRYVAPGFIDMHSHADRALVQDNVELRRAPNLVAQGITTVVFAPDGRNPIFPLADEIAAYRNPGVALNVIPMIGHGTVRARVMGEDYERPATDAEIRKMQELVRQAMETGAWGMGAGPEYRPGRFSTTEEIVALARVVAEFDGFYYSHQRSQSQLPKWQLPSTVSGWRLNATDGMSETIRIGRETGIRVVGSHIKSKGRSSWGHSSVDVLMIDRARKEGVQVFLDQYPYETFGGSPTRVIPQWGLAPPGTDRSGGLDDPAWRNATLFADYKGDLRKNLSDPVTRGELIRDIEFLVDLNGGADRLVIVVAPIDESLIGKTLAEVAEEQHMSAVDTLIDFTLRGTEKVRTGVLFRPLAAHPFDVANYMKQEYTATSSDAGVALQPRPGRHPRYFGAFPRKIARYVKDLGVISLPFAIRSMSGLAAEIVGLRDRGLLREGYAADLVIFDLERVRDRATILESSRYPEGIDYVITNGVLAVDEGRLTGALAGKVLIKPAR